MELELHQAFKHLYVGSPTIHLAETEEYFDAPSSLPAHAILADDTAALVLLPPFLEVKFSEILSIPTPFEPSWVMDSDTNTHMMGVKSSFNTDVLPLTTTSTISNANGYALDIKGKGVMHFDKNKFGDILYVLLSRCSLLSIDNITNTRKNVYFDSYKCHVFYRNYKLCMCKDPWHPFIPHFFFFFSSPKLVSSSLFTPLDALGPGPTFVPHSWVLHFFSSFLH